MNTKPQFDKSFSKKIWISILFLGFLIYATLASLCYVKKHQAVHPFSIKIHFFEDSDITVDFFSIFDKKCYLQNPEPGFYLSNSEYIRRCEITIDEKEFQRISQIVVAIGSEEYIVESKNLDSLFAIEHADNKIILRLTSTQIPQLSIVPVFRKCLNWKGDLAVISQALFQFLPFLILGVSLSCCLWITFFVKDAKGFFDIIEENSRRICLSSIFVLIVFSFIWIQRTYQRNDDYGILSSLRLGFPAPFIGSLLAEALIFFYNQVSQSFAWYGCLLYLTSLVSLLLFVYVIKVCIKNCFHAMLVAIPFMLIYPHSLSNLTFTQSAILLSGSSAAAFITYILRTEKIKISIVIALGILLALGFELRAKGTLMIFVFLAPLIIFIYAKMFFLNKKIFHDRIKFTLVFLAPILIFWGLEHLPIAKTHSPQQQAYEEFNHIRGKLHDFKVLRENRQNKKLLQKNDWSENDYLMFANWMFYDEQKFTTEKIKNLHALATKSSFFTNISPLHKLIFFIKKFNLYLVAYAAFFCVILLLSDTLSKRKSILLTLYFFYCLTLFLFLETFLKLPFYVFYPLFLFSISAATMFHHPEPANFSASQNFTKTRQFFLLALSTFLLLFTCTMTSNHRSKQQSERKYFASLSDNLNQNYAGKYILRQPDISIGLHMIDPLTREPERKYHTFSSGWQTFSPTFYAQLNTHGLTKGRDLFIQLYTNPNYYFFAEQNGKNLLAKYLQENFNQKVAVAEKQFEGHYMFQFYVPPTTP